MISIKNISKRYAARALFEDVSFDVLAGERIGLVGRNGHGKTTLLKLLSGRLKPVDGSIKIHTAALPAYYEQANTADLNDELTVEEEISPGRAFIDKSRARDMRRDDVFRRRCREEEIRYADIMSKLRNYD